MQTDPFIFASCSFDELTATATFRYRVGQFSFEEKTIFKPATVVYDPEMLDRALFLAFVLAGTSYYKCFPSRDIKINSPLDAFQTEFFNHVYQEGLGQFAYENQLKRDQLAHFVATVGSHTPVSGLDGDDMPYLTMQSGGKDSLLTATLVSKKHKVSNISVTHSGTYPAVINSVGSPRLIRRQLDQDDLKRAIKAGGMNGHVPITYILSSFALIQAILDGRSTILVSVGHEGEEAHAHIDDLAVNHQWSKSWQAEKDFAQYVSQYISPSMRIGSILRSLSELRISELFATLSWPKVGHAFSSCNKANYKLDAQNGKLKWCGECPKCANSFLLFSPFIDPVALRTLFAGQNLFEKPLLLETWKGILGIDGVMKPFECVGETTELQLAYHMARERWGESVGQLPFEVPTSKFDYQKRYPAQPWADELLDSVLED